MEKIKNIEKNSAWFLLTSLLATGCVYFWIYCLYPVQDLAMFFSTFFPTFFWILISLMLTIHNTRVFIASKNNNFLVSGFLLVLLLILQLFVQYHYAPSSILPERQISIFLLFKYLYFLIICLIMLLIGMIYTKFPPFLNPSFLKHLLSNTSNDDKQYSGEEMVVSCPEISNLSNVEFLGKMQEFCDFCVRNYISCRWVIRQQEIVIEPFTGGVFAPILKFNPKTTKIRISREGFVSLIIGVRGAKRHKKLVFTEKSALRVLEAFKNGLVAFLNGNEKEALCYFWGGEEAQQAEFKRCKKNKIVTYVCIAMNLALVIMTVILFSQFRSLIDGVSSINREKALDFIQNNQHSDGSIGYIKKIEKRTTPYWQTAASLMTLSQFGETRRVNVSAAAKYLASKQKTDGGGLQTCHCEKNKKGARDCRDPVASDPGSIAEMAFPVEALKSVGKLDAIDQPTLIKRIASSQDTNGLFIPDEHEGVDKYKFTYLCLLMLADMDALDAVDVNAAWKALVEAKSKTYPPRFLEIYLFDLSQKLNIDDSGIRKWIISRYRERIAPILHKDFDILDGPDDYEVNTLQQAADVYIEYHVEKRSLRKINYLLTPYMIPNIYETSNFFPQILAKEKIHAAFNSNFSDRAMMFSARCPVPIYVLALVIVLLTIRFGQKESRRLRYVDPACRKLEDD